MKNGFVTSKSENENFESKSPTSYNQSRRLPQIKTTDEAKNRSQTPTQTVYYRMDPKTKELTQIHKDSR